MSVGLILGKMPEKCKDCPLVQVNPEDDIGFRYCFNGEWCKLYDHKPRPDWCPLQEVEPTRYAEWLYVDEYDDLRRCSECCYEVKEENISQYCPQCGARMEGKNDE